VNNLRVDNRENRGIYLVITYPTVINQGDKIVQKLLIINKKKAWHG